MSRRSRRVAEPEAVCPHGHHDTHHPTAGCPLPNGVYPCGASYLGRLDDAYREQYDPYAENEWEVAEEMARWGVITMDGEITKLGVWVLQDQGWL